WDPARAWLRTVAVAEQAERLGFESIWLFDHFHTTPEPTDELTFEAFTSLSALAALTTRVRLGHVVLCSGYRNPALVAKMAGTLDVVSGGRFDLGIGAGWKRDEWLAYGYGFPPLKARLGHLRDSLEILTRMLAPGREHAMYEGEQASVRDAINLPRGLQRPHVPIMVGGNGQNVTWRLAARFADELNLDGPSPDEVRDWLPVIRARCEEVGRDPATLALSIHVWREDHEEGGPARVDRLARFRELGVSRVMGLLHRSATSDEALESLRDDALAAGASLDA
ncbi:MAG TPA: TIGR03560 family F420-dependent LLM class oxidoreductase, partial [Candidatus Dormibacteraeota bacterium]|nr:TIGR03560 family F420-dependent LLM class oxidoreductase [Candidatus Dormibacteraeota bacterium]